MRRQFPASILYWLTVGILFFVSAAGATVIYDVEVTYDSVYKYTFTMEFAELKPVLTQSDLVPGGGFLNKRFARADVEEWVLSSDVLPVQLTFLPERNFFKFRTSDVFMAPYTVDLAYAFSDESAYVQLPDGQLKEVRAFGNLVVERQPDGIPEPASVTLLGLGLAGLAGMCRRAKKQSSPALILHDTNAASE